MNNEEFNILRKRPHLVILGAGATRATIPQNDKNGLEAPVMDNFLETLQLTNLLKDIKLHTTSKNIENIYSELYDRKECNEVRNILEENILKYFRKFQLPDHPTIYDYLILSLRDKDCIASFNWDGLLLQAYNRIRKITDNLPELAFLHGCVSVGVCMDCKWYSPLKNKVCPTCKKSLVPVPILYPVRHKDYTSNIFIKQQWNVLADYISHAGFITIFGYNAPPTDVAAMNILKKEFGANNRFMDNIEVIELKEKDEVLEKWNYFAERTNWHFDVHKSFFKSILAEFPRRSIDGYIKRNFNGWWGSSSIQYKEGMTFDELHELVKPLLDLEYSDNFDVI